MSESFLQKKWVYNHYDKESADTLSKCTNIPPTLGAILSQHDFAGCAEANDFLYPSLASLPSPFLMKGMNEAVDLVESALKNKTKIVVYGDYDVDGVTATALLVNFFSLLNYPILYCQPDRFADGYGLSADLVAAKVAGDNGLLITVDCGISDFDSVKKLKEAGWQIIISDHHQPPDRMPEADAILNPWQQGCKFTAKNLAGVGVAFYLIMGIRSQLAKKSFWQGNEPPPLKPFLDLVAIGTLCDMVPLGGINRILTKAGLEVLSTTKNLGLASMMSTIGISQENVSSQDIGFQLGPRINAAGRVNHAELASELLITTDYVQAGNLSKKMEQLNGTRRELTSQVIDEAAVLAQSYLDNKGDKETRCLVLYDENWHQGVIGIAASKLVEMFRRPVVIISGDKILRGSARSVPGVNMHELFSQCKELLNGYGGHSAAAGLSIDERNIEKFRRRINRLASKTEFAEAGHQLNITVVVDDTVLLDLHHIIRYHNLLEPFGQTNPEPVYAASKRCAVRDVKVIGKEKDHLRFSVEINKKWFPVIGFHFGAAAPELAEKLTVEKIAFRLSYNRFRNTSTLQLQLQDFII